MEARDRINQFALNYCPKAFFGSKRTDLNALRELIRSLAPATRGRPLIRVGPSEDGGYLVPDDLDGIATCFSPGVNTESRFELECARRGMDVFMADASVDAPPDSHPNFHFLKKFVGNFSREDHIGMDDWVKLANPKPSLDWLMQIDIEGAEYEFLLGMPEEYLQRSRIILIEFHMLDYLLDEAFFSLANICFRKILNSHSCVHIHPNNCSNVVACKDIEIPKIMEFTFYRRDRFDKEAPANKFPHPLDVMNIPGSPDIVLPNCWQKPLQQVH
jgi:hypothetical protein